MSILLLLQGGGVTYEDTGRAVSGWSASGADAITFEDAGNAISISRASGADAVVIVDTGYAVSEWSASGADVYEVPAVPEVFYGGEIVRKARRVREIVYEDTCCAVTALH